MLIASNNYSSKRKRDVKTYLKEKGKQKPVSENEFKIPLSKPNTTELVENCVNLLLINLFFTNSHTIH